MPANHVTTVSHHPNRPANRGAYDVACPCSWISCGHDTRQAADSQGKQHEASPDR